MPTQIALPKCYFLEFCLNCWFSEYKDGLKILNLLQNLHPGDIECQMDEKGVPGAYLNVISGLHFILSFPKFMSKFSIYICNQNPWTF